MSIARVDQTDLGLSRIIEHNNKPNFQKLTKLYLDELQLVEDSLLVLAEMKDIDQAYGVWLDYIGKLVGIPRNSLTDDAYRKAIEFTIAINVSDGTINKTIELIRQYTNSDEVIVSEGTVAFVNLFVNGDKNINKSLYFFIERIKPLCTRWRITEDRNNKCFKFSWRLNSRASKNFEVTENGTDFSYFQTTTNTVDYSTFNVVTNVSTYDSPPQQRNRFPFKIARKFQTYDGGSMKDFQTTTDGEDYSDFYVTLLGDRSSIVGDTSYLALRITSES